MAKRPVKAELDGRFWSATLGDQSVGNRSPDHRWRHRWSCLHLAHVIITSRRKYRRLSGTVVSAWAISAWKIKDVCMRSFLPPKHAQMYIYYGVPSSASDSIILCLCIWNRHIYTNIAGWNVIYGRSHHLIPVLRLKLRPLKKCSCIVNGIRDIVSTFYREQG